MQQAESSFDFLAEHAERTVFFRTRLAPVVATEYVSPAVERLLGYSPEDFYERPGLPAEIAASGSDRMKLEHFYTEPEACPIPFQVSFIHRDGSRVTLEYEFRVQRDSTSAWVEGVAQDVTERIAKEEELERLTHALEEARIETLQRLALAAEYRDDETHHHTQRVAETCALVCRAMGVPPTVTRVIKLAAPLHDVGKIGIPDRILLKPGGLTGQEFEDMKTHTTIGAAILSGSHSSILNAGADIALSHHERWDGRGYPLGMAGEAIPLAARILAVADVLDALTHDRPYKKAWPLDRSLEEIRAGRGTQFDPDVVDALLCTVEVAGVSKGAIDLDRCSSVPPPRAAQTIDLRTG